MVEHRLAPEFRVSGRTLSGTIIRYGTVSPGHRERFVPGAFAPVPAVPMRLQHDPSMEVLPAGGFILSDGPRALEIRAELPASSAAINLTRRGKLSGWSIGFNSLQERRLEGIRVVERAELVEVSLVDEPSYPDSLAEVRARSGRTIRQRIPADTDVACECSGTCKQIQMLGAAVKEAIESAYEDVTREILAVRGSYGTPLASKSAGSVRARMVGNDAEVEIDLPTGPDGDAVLRDVENTGAVLVRPYLDRDLSVGEIETRAEPDPERRVLVYSKIRIRSFVVSATDARQGWPAPELVPTPDELMPEGRAAAPAKRSERRRLWL